MLLSSGLHLPGQGGSAGSLIHTTSREEEVFAVYVCSVKYIISLG